jgi:hypothetical protein
MSEAIAAEVVLWQHLGKYLKTEVEVGKPELVPEVRIHGRSTECIRLKVRFSNTAPDEPDMPKVVFTGVGTGIVSPGRESTAPPTWATALVTEDIPKYEMHIQGSVSRRHFFHYDRVLAVLKA